MQLSSQPAFASRPQYLGLGSHPTVSHPEETAASGTPMRAFIAEGANRQGLGPCWDA